MKWTKAMSAFYICALLFPGITDCTKYSDLSDQNPMLVVNVQVDPLLVVDDAHKIYLLYYNTSTPWVAPTSAPWLMQSTTGNQFFNPVVLSFSSMYLAVFYDADSSTTLSSGDPCIGYLNADPTVPDPLTKIEFLPLELKQINITLNAAPTYP